MWRALNILDVGLFLVLDAAVRQLLLRDGLSSVEHLAGAFPVPIQAASVLKTSHFFISQSSDDLQHAATIAVEAEHFMVQKL